MSGRHVAVDDFLDARPDQPDSDGIVRVCREHARLFCDHRRHRRAQARKRAAVIALAAVVVWLALSAAFWWAASL